MTSKDNKEALSSSSDSDDTGDISKDAKLEKYMSEPAINRLDNFIGAVTDKDE